VTQFTEKPLHYLNADKRHYLQQCDYTICTEIRSDNQPCYISHENASFGITGGTTIRKYLLPSSERKKALMKLDHSYNINAYSLFGSEESLMEAAFLRELYLKN
jgi:hypothetical protein